MTDRLLPSNTQCVLRIDGLMGTTRKSRPTEGSNNTRAAFLSVGYEDWGGEQGDVFRQKLLHKIDKEKEKKKTHSLKPTSK